MVVRVVRLLEFSQTGVKIGRCYVIMLPNNCLHGGIKCSKCRLSANRYIILSSHNI